jgi:uncharacterized protein YwqG
MNPVNFPSALAEFQEKFLESKKDFVKIVPNLNDKEILLWQSKFGGMPFLPLNVDYPKDDEGKYMYLLAQINFEELPTEIDLFPKKGLLQIYLTDDDMYGLNLDNPTEQTSFRILYFPEFDRENFQRDLPTLPNPENNPLFRPLQAVKISFEIASEIVGIADFNFRKIFGNTADTIIELYYDNEEVSNFLSQYALNGGHKMGGYATFVQDDPRSYNEELTEYDTLLLQIDTDEFVQWGDMGIANFFINHEKLKKADFSDVLYNWDCG